MSKKSGSNTPEFAKCTLRSIINNYRETEKAIVAQLNFEVEHGPIIGGFREEIWKELFKQLVPKKFVIEQNVFLMDSFENVSKEVDLAIFDEMYTPYIFRNGRIKFIPIEAVAAVVQCKSNELNSENLKTWSDSVRALHTSPCAIVRTADKIITQNPPTQTGTRPIMVLCHLDSTLRKTVPFDFELAADNGEKRIHVRTDPGRSLNDWYIALNHVGRSDVEERGKIPPEFDHMLSEYRIIDDVGQPKEEVTLLSFNLQFNQLLMLINNPMPFPHKAYADLFNRVNSKMSDKDRPAKKAERVM